MDSARMLSKARPVMAALVLVLSASAVFWPAFESRADEPRFVYSSGSPTFWNLADDDGRAYLGVHVEEETEYDEGGARITHVEEGSAADAGGLQDGDIIVGLGGKTVRGPRGLTRRLGDSEPGDSVTIRIVRDGTERSFDVELGERPGLFGYSVAPRALASLCDDDDCGADFFFGHGRPLLGVELANTTPELRNHLGGDDDSGILVAKVLRGTPAEAADIRVGDLIVAVDGEPVKSAGSIRSALRGKQGEVIEVEVVRDRSPLGIRVSLPEPDESRPTGPRARYYPRAPELPALPSLAPLPSPPAPPSPSVMPPMPPMPPMPTMPAPVAPGSLELAV